MTYSFVYKYLCSFTGKLTYIVETLLSKEVVNLNRGVSEMGGECTTETQKDRQRGLFLESVV